MPAFVDPYGRRKFVHSTPAPVDPLKWCQAEWRRVERLLATADLAPHMIARLEGKQDTLADLIGILERAA